MAAGLYLRSFDASSYHGYVRYVRKLSLAGAYCGFMLASKTRWPLQGVYSSNTGWGYHKIWYMVPNL